METQKTFTDTDRAALAKLSPINNEIAKQFAAENGFSVYQVRSVATRSDEIEYQSIERTRKDGSKVELKSEIVEDVAKLLGQDVESLGKATRDVIVLIRDALAS